MTTALEGVEWSAARPGRTLPHGKDPVPIVKEAGWTPGPVWTWVNVDQKLQGTKIEGDKLSKGIRAWKQNLIMVITVH